MRILILNQYAPPDPAPTAQLIGELATALEAAGHEVWIASSSQAYRSKRPQRFGRVFREVFALAKLLLDGLRQPNHDIVLSTSSPPGLLVVATLLAFIRRSKSLHWALDLYPELAFRLDPQVPRLFQNLAHWMVGCCYRQVDTLITLDGDMQSHLRELYDVDSRLIRPWVLQRNLPYKANYPPKDPFRWIYSGNLGLAHDWKTLLEAQSLLESQRLPIRLVFQGGGAHWPATIEFARAHKLKQVDWVGYVSPQDVVPSLLASHVLVVTQNPLTRGLLWPSKLGLVMKLPRPLVFVGSSGGAIAAELERLPGAKVFEPGQSDRLARYIADLYEHWPPEHPPFIAQQDERHDALQDWLLLIERLGSFQSARFRGRNDPQITP
ncbi:MAG: glycosyltransferase family 4 protein [Verrucomicrobia bacterium]|nr:glycosyltransferase family 4 protein [Verrucomicrobiota bacterium]MBV8273741.1 glycosyltransferase family 4 protein [Verrucomicrobiota bacterium]